MVATPTTILLTLPLFVLVVVCGSHAGSIGGSSGRACPVAQEEDQEEGGD